MTAEPQGGPELTDEAQASPETSPAETVATAVADEPAETTAAERPPKQPRTRPLKRRRAEAAPAPEAVAEVRRTRRARGACRGPGARARSGRCRR